MAHRIALLKTLAALEVWLVGSAVAASVASERLLPVALALAALFWGIRWLATGRPSRATPLDWPVQILVALLPITLLVTPQTDVTGPQVARLLSGIALYYTLVNWATSRARLRVLLVGLLLAGLGLAVATPFTTAVVFDKLPGFLAAIYSPAILLVSDTINANVMAGQLVLLLGLALALLGFGGRHVGWAVGLLAAALALLGLAMLVFIQSRGGFVALMALLAVLLLLRRPGGWLVLGSLLLTGGLAMLTPVGARLVNLVSSEQFVQSSSERGEILVRSLLLIRDSPLTGVGMGAFEAVAAARYPFVSVAPGTAPHAHNLLLQITLDLGIGGLLAWLACFALVVIAAFRIYQAGRTRADGWLTGLGAGLLASQAALFAHGLLDSVTWGLVRPAVLVWALWALAIAGWQVAAALPPPTPRAEPARGGHRIAASKNRTGRVYDLTNNLTRCFSTKRAKGTHRYKQP